ncbi:hypothetical protein GLX30_05555 [Streptomyces sp. Tu 2975]|uniref:hypothetical protein n=1 Tax=Streptomyces sp. Tu 2975 TaxID=2676871 RepID=UPI0013597B26|nr:hypothetical protein [Streptomyces sp. Tu 2975]QIP88379.1 hypothetical protein GLX30_05555 [Streptomyces sp. Tu 2975]
MHDRSSQSTIAEDQGCLRWFLGVPLVMLYLVAGWFCWTALTIRPSGPWDDDARAGIVLSCVLTIAAAGLALLITLTPSARRALARWWLAPPLVLGMVAAVRWVGPN